MSKHIPVLLERTLELLSPQRGESYLDLTAGYGGHAQKVLDITHAPHKSTLVDRDINAINALKGLKEQGARLIHEDFYSATRGLVAASETFDMILLDLGISSPHVDEADRGFSLRSDGTLDMRMDQSQELTAKSIVNEYSLNSLTEIISEYGEERRAKKVAQAIVDARPIDTTHELAEIVRLALPGPRKKVHPATKTFQAIRIAVNNELEQIELTLPLVLELLAPGGRVAVISFHSLEDRIAKKFLKEESSSGYEARIKLLNKKPFDGSLDDVFNPRARSAKLRAALKNPR